MILLLQLISGGYLASDWMTLKVYYSSVFGKSV